MSDEPYPHHPSSISVQTLLYQTPVDAIERSLEALDNSARIGFIEQQCSGFAVVMGDASPNRLLSNAQLDEWREKFPHIQTLVYKFFNKNTGTSKGHNALAKLYTDSEYIVTANPDVVAEPRALWRMLTAFNDRLVGMVEAKQLPIEHPKDYEVGSGFTSWATTAFAMTRRSLFDDLEGFDAASFFMYCDDVDYSWRVREAGFKIVFQPSAVVFHDKHLSTEGRWMPTGAEIQFSASAALMMAHKWSRNDIVEKILGRYRGSKDPMLQETAAAFTARRTAGKLVAPRDPKGKVATFVGTNYEKHRFSL